MGETRNALRILLTKSLVKRLVGNSTRRWVPSVIVDSRK